MEISIPLIYAARLDPLIRVFGIKKLSNLYSSLKWKLVKRPDGSTLADDYIASTLGVASLPYASNDTDAQTLLPAGWSWGGTYPSGMYYAVRGSDG
jgi:hypothetical protein